MSEKLPAALPANAGATTPDAALKNLAAESAPLATAAVAAAPNSPPALFGGHNGGGKKRLDGLIAGSPEAIEADREKNAARMRAVRAAKKGATLPPPLPPANSPEPDAADPLAGSSNAVPGPVAAVAVPAVAVVAGVFVPWTSRLLEKPARLLTKIVDRARIWQLNKKLRLLKLDSAKEKEMQESFSWKAEAVADFNASLAACAEVELNKRRVGGAENSHLINLALSGGELAYAHFQTLELLEKLAIENRKPETKVN